jgi:hypothetical protein
LCEELGSCAGPRLWRGLTLVQCLCEELGSCARPRPWRGLRQRTLWGRSHVGAGRRQGFAAPRPWPDWRRRAIGGHIHNGAGRRRSTSTLRQEGCCPASVPPLYSVPQPFWGRAWTDGLRCHAFMLSTARCTSSRLSPLVLRARPDLLPSGRWLLCRVKDHPSVADASRYLSAYLKQLWEILRRRPPSWRLTILELSS